MAEVPVDRHRVSLFCAGCLEAIPTSFKLAQAQVELLRQAGYYLVLTSDDFNTAMAAVDKDWTRKSAAIDLALIARTCPIANP